MARPPKAHLLLLALAPLAHQILNYTLQEQTPKPDPMVMFVL